MAKASLHGESYLCMHACEVIWDRLIDRHTVLIFAGHTVLCCLPEVICADRQGEQVTSYTPLLVHSGYCLLIGCFAGETVVLKTA